MIFYQCCESGLINSGSGSRDKFWIQPDPELQHFILLPITTLFVNKKIFHLLSGFKNLNTKCMQKREQTWDQINKINTCCKLVLDIYLAAISPMLFPSDKIWCNLVYMEHRTLVHTIIYFLGNLCLLSYVSILNLACFFGNYSSDVI